MNHTISKPADSTRIEPVLQKLLNEAKQDDQQLQQMLDLLGWGDLPEELKIEIIEDVKAFGEELDGYFSTCDPAVYRRRNRIAYWVRTWKEGNCTLQTAAQAVRVKI